MLYLSANIQDHVIEAFNSTLRYLNDLLNIENLYFEQISVEINNFPFLDGDVQRSLYLFFTDGHGQLLLKCKNCSIISGKTNISLPCDAQIIRKKVSFRNIENLQNKKTADSVLLSLFMRTNGKCNNSHAPSTGLSHILLSVRNQYS